VTSNLGFAVIALWGWLRLARRAGIPACATAGPATACSCRAVPHRAGLVLVPPRTRQRPPGLGPPADRPGLRRPAGRRAGRCAPARQRKHAILLALAAVASVAWWRFTDLAGAGDLRPYLLLQGLPILLIPLWQWIYKAPAADRMAFGGALALYVVAKFAELGDHQIAAALGVVTGHTLKHLLATGAAALIVGRLVFRVRAPLKACAGACPPAPPSATSACR
jgi:hypothetical protein